MSVFQFFRFSGFQFPAPDRADRKPAPPRAPGVIPETPRIGPGICLSPAQSAPLSDTLGADMPLPSGGSPPRTRPLRRQFSTISVNTKTQLVVLI